MAWDNDITADQLAALEPGTDVLFEEYRDTWSRASIRVGEVVRLTPTRVVVHCAVGDRNLEFRFRRDDGRKHGGRGALLNPEHPKTLSALAADRKVRWQQLIDSLVGIWQRDRDNMDVLRRLHVAIGEYRDAEEPSDE